MTIAPLVAEGDADLAAWQSGTPATYLKMACDEVRKFCGWHIAPSEPITGKVCWLGERGLVMLGATHVSAVSAVAVLGQTLTADTDYTWQAPKGWLRIHPQSLSGVWPNGDPNAVVSFTSGYDETPMNVKSVIFEVMATAMELPASNANQIKTMQYEFHLNPNIGISLSDIQKERLGPYRLRSFGGLVRP